MFVPTGRQVGRPRGMRYPLDTMRIGQMFVIDIPPDASSELVQRRTRGVIQQWILRRKRKDIRFMVREIGMDDGTTAIGVFAVRPGEQRKRLEPR